MLSKDYLIEYLKELFGGKLKRESSVVWSGLVCAACYISASELQEHIIKAFDDLIDTSYICLEDVEDSIQMDTGLNSPILSDKKFKFITDTIGDLKWWACFKND